jgi:hypothetical protein
MPSGRRGRSHRAMLPGSFDDAAILGRVHMTAAAWRAARAVDQPLVGWRMAADPDAISQL